MNNLGSPPPLNVFETNGQTLVLKINGPPPLNMNGPPPLSGLSGPPPLSGLGGPPS